MEMYSPPRVTEEAQRWGPKTGEAMDLTTGWNFRRQDHRNQAWRYVEEKKPMLVIGSPMCTIVPCPTKSLGVERRETAEVV